MGESNRKEKHNKRLFLGAAKMKESGGQSKVHARDANEYALALGRQKMKE